MPYPTQKDVDTHGKVRCFDVNANKYVRRYAIDVREGMAIGSIAQFDPKDEDPVAQEAESNKLSEIVAKATQKQLAALIDEHQLDLNLDSYEKVAEKREAVAKALGLDTE